MIHGFKPGDEVRVWPAPGLLVQEHPSFPGRFLPKEGKALSFTTWVHERLRDGSMLLTDPSPKQDDKPSAKPAKDK